MAAARYIGLLLPLAGVFLLGASAPQGESGPASAEREHNRKLLQKWKADPEHYARLRQDLADFWELPQAHRERLRRLDREFHQLDAQTQKRLWRVAERYAAWLERLSDDERGAVEQATDPKERLRVVREIRERQWVQKLPRKVREDLERLPPAEQADQVARLRRQERQQRLLWTRGGQRTKQPTRLAELPAHVRDFVEKNVLPQLTTEERRRYEESVGRWPEFARTVKELAHQHPVLPPLPPPHHPVISFDSLPAEAKGQAGAKVGWERRTEDWARLRQAEGKWPQWALTFHALLTDEQKRRMPPLGASQPKEFPPAVRTFIEQKLHATATQKEWKQLKDLEGKWPAYPLRLLRLAEQHKLEVPGMSLPGPAELWDTAR